MFVKSPERKNGRVSGAGHGGSAGPRGDGDAESPERGEIGCGFLVDETDDAVAAKGHPASQALSGPESGVQKAPRKRDERDLSALGVRDAADQIAEGPGMRISQSDGLAGDRVEAAEGSVPG